MSIGHRPGVVRVPTIHVHSIRPPLARCGYSPAAEEGPDLYVTTIEHAVPVGTVTTIVAFEPASTGEVSDSSLTFPLWLALVGGVGDAVGEPLLPPPVRHRKPRIGCNSIAFGATPVWPCSKSKNATPVTRAREQTRRARRAAAICACRLGYARVSHVGAGDSVIIVRCPSLRTTW
jgi:hypothetical protein